MSFRMNETTERNTLRWPILCDGRVSLGATGILRFDPVRFTKGKADRYLIDDLWSLAAHTSTQ